MKIFASWSGEDSLQAAELFRIWFPNVIQEVDVWVSSQDIGKGEKWQQSLWHNLSEHDFGVQFVTKRNFNAPWILFEAGALSKAVKSRHIPIFCNVDRVDILTSPLNQFQNLMTNKGDMFELAATVNSFCARPLSADRLKLTFEKWWPEWQSGYEAIDFRTDAAAAPISEPDRLERIEHVLTSVVSSIQGINRLLELAPTGIRSQSAKDLYKSLPAVGAKVVRAGGSDSENMDIEAKMRAIWEHLDNLHANKISGSTKNTHDANITGTPDE